MSTYNQIAWLPLCGGVTGLGLVLSWLAWRRKGFAAGLRGAAWSLLPIAAYLTGAIEMFWKIGSAVGTFASSFVFSPRVWSGVAVAGLAFVLFVASGTARRHRSRRVPAPKQPAPTAGSAADRPAIEAGATTPMKPAKTPKAKVAKRAASGDDEFGEIEEILRRRGIN
jgi:hypothetical protein